MDKLPENMVDTIYRFEHEMSYSSVMKQLKTYRLNIVFTVSIEFFLLYGCYEFKGVRIPCIDLNNINATCYEILYLINNDNNK